VVAGTVAGGDEDGVGVGEAGAAQAAALHFTAYADPIVAGARQIEKNHS
jgi:hypothetical protein